MGEGPWNTTALTGFDSTTVFVFAHLVSDWQDSKETAAGLLIGLPELAFR
jgi:hypothetical protein